MSREKTAVYEKLYKLTFAETIRAAERIPAEKRMRQAKDTKAHPLWLLGHLTFETDSILNSVLMGGQISLPAEFGTMFAPNFVGGMPVSADASTYPTWSDLIDCYKSVTNTALQSLASTTDQDLAGGIKGTAPQGFEKFFTSFEGVLDFMLLHDAYHRGQMGLLAKL